tara:strand:+ start:258 stop:890 length:633 start_codon:yes stop_codon:yes gene_type:complete
MTLNRRSLQYAQWSHYLICGLLNKKELSYYPIKFNWNEPDSKRLLTKVKYDNVFHATNHHTGFITQGAIDARIKYDLNPKFDKDGKKKSYQPCYDHVTTPQFVSRYLVDCRREIFDYSEKGWNEYLYWFEFATSVIETTNPENTAVRKFTKFRKGKYEIYESSDKKYSRAGLVLCERPDGVKEWSKAVPTDKVFTFNQDFLDYEKQFLVN